ncbi:DUF475 domain-containing protein [Massilia sp. TS11]|uniref:DUF475 domain-containing protein n=1 Tax=Massilia sp. TS11 TaxID=2908003 RepID=UPI001EDB618D|nr:DUF475 domain-containing protein [Massilia sp. TS11]MCG2585347.1 DUF475 domain-containing protein [Massilia sp. TS11]
MKHFTVSFVVTAVCLALAGWWGFERGGASGALTALMLASILAVLEVSLSFDNAVLNASVLRGWDAFWRKLFLGLGMIIAVFGMRLVFPIMIVAVAADLSWPAVWQLALNDPQAYAHHLHAHHAEVAAFGGMFLLLVFLNFLLDADKEAHWLGPIERELGKLGRVSSVSVMVALAVLLASVQLVAPGQQLAALTAGLYGILAYVGVGALTQLLGGGEAGASAGALVQKGGIGAFLYLELLDASFSFDGVIGAFAITTDIVIIMLGLAIGAMFVRSMTVYLVEKGTLEQFVFLEHGAHYAIGVLAAIMLVSMKYEIPEVVTGLAGALLIGASIWSSLRHRRRSQ